ncbi:MAG: YqeG family HAD IIIA-type phosphatase [Thermogutta sp.]|uniref:YqeG family HAD IIIA-type phosphatase n=1 Tax=Thermogutta sp. TaxID=1962930 RepID=UPI0019A86845|nr:YqeG family HAD IIIA-type phosphatase [Thermogutta sp.]
MRMWWMPDYYVKSVTDLRPACLQNLNIKGLCIDVDCTLTDYVSNNLPPEVAQWLDQIRHNGINVCLLSNGGKRRIKRLADRIGVPYVARAMKPLPFGCHRALRELGLPRSEVAIVGDQLFADVLAGRWAGVRTILVVPRGADREGLITKWKRPLERLLLKSLTPKSLASCSQEANAEDRVKRGDSSLGGTASADEPRV